ncbi:hypothetical protein Mapa_007585 [Marchantia paleacea]|nr:hypothetical protein Mapa_007585 [Marchantia paleacea]
MLHSCRSSRIPATLILRKIDAQSIHHEPVTFVCKQESCHSLLIDLHHDVLHIKVPPPWIQFRKIKVSIGAIHGPRFLVFQDLLNILTTSAQTEIRVLSTVRRKDLKPCTRSSFEPQALKPPSWADSATIGSQGSNPQKGGIDVGGQRLHKLARTPSGESLWPVPVGMGCLPLQR